MDVVGGAAYIYNAIDAKELADFIYSYSSKYMKSSDYYPPWISNY